MLNACVVNLGPWPPNRSGSSSGNAFQNYVQIRLCVRRTGTGTGTGHRHRGIGIGVVS